MRKLVALTLCGLFSFMAGCATVKIEAPRGTSVALQSGVEAQPLVVKKKLWYAIWGLVPISNNSTAAMVKEENLTEMSVKTFTSFDDFLISYFLGIATIQTKTVEVHGK